MCFDGLIFYCEPHQRALAARVAHRMQRKRLYVDMISMPTSVGRRFLDFGDFRKGEPDLRGFTHEFSARENVNILGKESAHRKKGYVADESEMSVVLIDLMGNSFRKIRGMSRPRRVAHAFV